MIYIMWEFEVESSRIASFEEIYGSQGAWALLFSQSKNYYGTMLLKDHAQLTRYITIDRWDKIDDFEKFKTQYFEAYNNLDHQCEHLTLTERKIGIFDEVKLF